MTTRYGRLGQRFPKSRFGHLYRLVKMTVLVLVLLLVLVLRSFAVWRLSFFAFRKLLEFRQKLIIEK